MNRSSILLAMTLVATAAGCGGFGGSGGSGSGRSTAPITSGTAGPVISGSSYIPTQVTRDKSYNWSVAYQPNFAAGGAITAATVAPTGTDMFVGISPLGRVDRLDASGSQSEVSFVFDVSAFAVLGSNVYAATANPIAARAGQVYGRDELSGQWMLSLDGTLKECVPAAFNGNLFAFQGENDGRAGTISVLTSSATSWKDIGTLGSFVPTCAQEFNGEVFVGGHFNSSKGGSNAKLLHGNGVTMTEIKVPTVAGFSQVVSVRALGVANNTLFVATETQDAATGQTLGGSLFILDPKGLIAVNNMTNDAPICLASLDGTIYAGTRGGKLQWLDEKAKWNDEAGLPSNLGVTSVINNNGVLYAGVRSAQGAQLVKRAPGSGVVTPPPSGSALTFTSITPANGPLAGGTTVTIQGNNFATVTLVEIGGTPLANLKVVSDTVITGTTPAGTAGAKDVKITSTSKGSVTKAGAFTYGNPAPAALSYATDLLPILNAKCTSCHTSGFKELTPYNVLLSQKSAGGQSYVVPSNSAGSLIVQKTGAGGSMRNYLSTAEAQKIKDWVDQGAKQ